MTSLISLAGEPLADERPVGDAAPEAPPAAREAGTSPAAPLVTLAGERMSVTEQVRTGIRTALRTVTYRWRDLNSREGGLPHAIYHYNGDSLAELDEYTRSRAWVKSGYDGGVAELTVVAWDRSVGWMLVLLGGWIKWTGARWLRGTITFLVIYLLAAIIAYALGSHGLAGGMILGLLIFAVTAYSVLAFLAGRRHRQPVHAAPPEED